MDKIQLNKYIKSIADQIPVVNSFYTDDVYEVWNGEEIRYGSLCFCITSSSISDNTTTWNGLLYYGDRLLDDKSNRDSVQSDANNVINAIMNVIAQDEDIVAINYPTAVTFFEQKFADYLAGGYADIQIETDNSISKCGYGFVKEQEGCAGKIAELEDEIEVLEEKNDRLSDLLDTTNETLELAERNLMSCRKANEVLTESNQQLETENDRLESEVERLEESLSILPDYTSIGYNLENAGALFETEYEAIEYAKKIQREWNPDTYIAGMFFGDLNLVYMPYVQIQPTNIYNTISAAQCFEGCSKLKYVPRIIIPQGGLTSIFKGCTKLDICECIMSGYSAISNAFHSCKSLSSVPNMKYWKTNTDTPFSAGMLFYNCESLTNLDFCDGVDTSMWNDMNFIVGNCRALTNIDGLSNWDTSRVTNFNYAFNYCTELTNIDALRNWSFESANSITSMFSSCEKLTQVDAMSNWDLSNVKVASDVFSNCSALESVPLLDFSSVTTISAFFGYGNLTKLTDLGGFTGLKVNFDALQRCPNLTVQSLLNVFNTIADVNGLGARTLTLGTTNLNKLTDDQKAIATAKGWTLK
jgi:surface protein